MGNPVDTTAGLTPPPVEMAPMEVRPARPAEPMPASAGYGGKTAGGLNIAASFLEGWMRGKQMHELAARKKADTEVAGHRQMFVQAVQGYRDFVASEPKPTDPAKLAEWEHKESSLKAAAAASQQHYADVMQKYTFPEEQTAKGAKGKLKQFGSNVKKEMTPQDPHMFAQTVMDAFRKQPIEAALQGGGDQRIREAELGELKARTAHETAQTAETSAKAEIEKGQAERWKTADSAAVELEKAKKAGAPPEKLKELNDDYQEKQGRALLTAKGFKPQYRALWTSAKPIDGKELLQTHPDARVLDTDSVPVEGKHYAGWLTDQGIKVFEVAPPAATGSPSDYKTFYAAAKAEGKPDAQISKEWGDRVVNIANRKIPAAQMVQSSDPNTGQPRLEVMPGPERKSAHPKLTPLTDEKGDAVRPKLAAASQARVAQADTIIKQGAHAKQFVLSHPEIFGPVAGRINSLEEAIGSQDVNVARAATMLKSFGLFQPGLHLARGKAMSDEFLQDAAKLWSNPPALAAKIDEYVTAAQNAKSAILHGSDGEVPPDFKQHQVSVSDVSKKFSLSKSDTSKIEKAPVGKVVNIGGTKYRKTASGLEPQ